MKKTIRVIFALTIISSGLVFSNGAVVAEGSNLQDKTLCKDTSVPKELREAAGCNTNKLIPDVVNALLNFAMGAIGVVAIGAIIYGGVTYVTSAGDPGKAKKARDIIVYSVVGLVVTLLAFAIVNFINGGLK